jgi:CobQ-like glutamine amidotransferase family enzyme
MGPVVTGPGPTPLVVAVVYPDLLGTYGDGGNGLILARRASWRGIATELIQAYSGAPLPEADIYCIGGGEDGPEVRSAEALRQDGTLARMVERGAVVFGVCAGYQLLGRSFPDSAGRPHEGLGLLDITTRKGHGARAVGELVAIPTADAPPSADGAPLPDLTGFENHSALTTVGPGARALATVVRGIGNGGGDGTEGAWNGRVLGTYLHGPVLARNPALADLLLGWGVSAPDSTAPLDRLDDRQELALRAERLGATEASAGSRFFRRLTRTGG